MLTAHPLIFLSPEHDRDPARRWFESVNGLPAPAFILSAGFAFALVASRDGGERGARWSRAMRSLRRIGTVLLASLLLRHVLWNAFRHLERFLWVDVLTCIALMLLTTWAVFMLLPPRAWVRIALMGVLFASAFGVSPWVEAPRDFGVWTTLLNNGPHSDTWPIVPWAGYGWGAAVVGVIVARSHRPQVTLAWACVAMAAVGWCVAQMGPLVRAVDPSVNPYVLTNAGERVWKLAVVCGVLLGLERLGLRSLRAPTSLLSLLGRTSLVAYVGHLILIFGYAWFRPFNRFIGQVDWPAYVVLTAAVIGITIGLCWMSERVGTWRGMGRLI